MVRLLCISPESIDSVWDKAEHFIAKVVKKEKPQFYSADDIKELCKKQLEVLWLIIDEKNKKCAGIMVTKIVSYPKGKQLVVHLAGADDTVKMAGWRRNYKQLKDYARSSGCMCMTVYGRSGWAKISSSIKRAGFILNEEV